MASHASAAVSYTILSGCSVLYSPWIMRNSPSVFSSSHSPAPLTSESDNCPLDSISDFFLDQSTMDQSFADLNAHWHDLAQVRKSALPGSLG